MYPNSRISERQSLLATIDPASQAAGPVTTGFVSVANHERLMALVLTGVLGTAATVDAKLVQAKDASGTGAKDITGKAITQIVKASGDNKQAMINLRADELDTNNGFAFVQLSITVGAAASQVGGTLVGDIGKNYPASAFNQAAVAQIV